MTAPRFPESTSAWGVAFFPHLAAAEPGAQVSSQDLMDAVAPQLKLVALLLLGAVAVAVGLGFGLGWVWRAVTKRKTSWWWFAAFGVFLGGAVLTASILVVLLAFR